MQFNYKSHAKTIFFMAFGIPFTIFFIFALLFLFDKPIYAPANYRTADALTLAHYRYKNRDITKSTIFFIAGSNGQVGIHTPILNNKLSNYNILNFSTFIQMPISFHFNLLKKYAKKGDIIILPMEFPHIISHELAADDFNYQQFTTWGIKYRNLLPERLRRYIFFKGIFTYWTRLPHLGKSMPISSEAQLVEKFITKDTIFNFNQYSEVFADKSSIVDVNTEDVAKIPQSTGAYAKASIEDFLHYCQKNSIQLHFTYPVTLKSEKFDVTNETTKKQLKVYTDQYKKLGVSFFGTPEFYNLDVVYMYDTFFHPTATGTVMRSLFLAEDIKTYVFNEKPSYIKGKEKEFFKQIEKEAKEYMQKIRTKHWQNK